MIAFNPARALKLTIGAGILGTLVAFLAGGARTAAGFAIGAGISYASIHSWLQLADSLSGKQVRTPLMSAIFMMSRYLVIGAAIYGTINLLGTSPVAMITGLLVSFAAVIAEVLYANNLK